jgi:hypothetical protein
VLIQDVRKHQEASLKELRNKYLEMVMNMPGAESASDEDVHRMKMNLLSSAGEPSNWTSATYTPYPRTLHPATLTAETVVQQQPDSSVADEDFLFSLNEEDDKPFNVQPIALTNLPFGYIQHSNPDVALSNMHQPSTSTVPVSQGSMLSYKQSDHGGSSLSPDTTTLSPTNIVGQSVPALNQYQAPFDNFPILDLMDDCL